MNATGLISQLSTLGVRMQVSGDELKIRAPKGVLSAELRESLKLHKPELLRLLRTSNTESKIEVLDRGVALPVSTTQERFLILAELYPDGIAYNLPNLHELTGPLDDLALERAINSIVQRHEALRTVFPRVNGSYEQKILSVPNHTFDWIDVSDSADSYAEALAIASQDANLPFELQSGPLLRVKLIKSDDCTRLLSWVLHHSISDGWSSMIFLRELKSFYEEYTGGNTTKPTELNVQYADFGAWQRQQLESDSYQSQLEYWIKRFGKTAPILSLPTDYPRPPVKSYRGNCIDFTIDPILADRLGSLSRENGVTLFVFLLTAFKVLLHRYTGQSDICVGTPVAGRNDSDVENVYGCFINTLALYSDIQGERSFSELLSEVGAVCKNAFAHQEVPFERVVEAVNPERHTSYTPLFQAMFIFHVQDTRKVDQLGPVAIAPVNVHSESAKYDVTLEITELAEGLRGFIEYSSDLFKKSTIRRMVGHFTTLLEAIAQRPALPVSQHPLLTEPELHQLTVQWNSKRDQSVTTGALLGSETDRSPCQASCQNTAEEGNEPLLLPDMFALRCKETPEALAVLSNEQSLTYQQLDTQSSVVANYLLEQGLQAGSLVGVCLSRSINLVVALLGVMKAGGSYVPMDPEYPDARLQHMLNTCQLKFLLTESQFRNTCPDYTCVRICMDSDLSSSTFDDEPNLKVSSDDIAYVIFTSGSTGTPKGVQITHGAMGNFLSSMAIEPGLTRSDRLLAVTTLSFDISVLELFLPLSVGACVVVADRDSVTDGASIAQLISRCNISVLQATPSTWRLLLMSGWAGKSSIKALCGGEALDQVLANQLLPKVGELWNMYGPTETTVWSTCYRLTGLNQPIRIGAPIANTQCFVLDSSMQPVPVGVPGELYIGGTGVSAGYLHRDDLTADRFISAAFPSCSSTVMYRTGDLVCWRESGELEYLQRMDHQVKIRGFRIELGDIEAALARYPSVLHSAAKLSTDAAGEKRVVGYVVSSQHVNTSELRSFLLTELPAFMLPSSYVVLDELPLTENGKTDRSRLPEPDAERPVLDNEFVRADTEAEAVIAKIWQDLLHIEMVGVNDNFFDLGGHSLLLVKVQARLQEHFGKQLVLLDLFRHTTIRSTARLLNGDADSGSAINRGRQRASKQQERLARMKQVRQRQEI